MKCPRCGNEVKEYENEKYCSKCGFPINTPANDGHCPLHRMMFDVDARALVVNGTRYSTVKGFSMGAWDRVKHWLPKEYQKEEIDICDISKKEVTDDEYI